MVEVPKSPKLPDGYRTIKEVFVANPGSMVNVVGLVSEWLPPMQTRRDFKSTVKLIDTSIDEDPSSNLPLYIFAPLEKHPSALQVGDVVLACKVKVQRLDSGPCSIITNWKSSIVVLDKDKFPQNQSSAKGVVKFPVSRNTITTDAEFKYASWLYSQTRKNNLPSEETFLQRTDSATNRRDKFSLLENVKSDTFYNLVVCLVKRPFVTGHTMTLWVSDYTENEHFFPVNFSDEASGDGRRLNDPQDRRPRGKLSMQITIWNPGLQISADYEPNVGDYLSLENVLIKIKSGGYMEGSMHEDSYSRGPKVFHHPVSSISGSDRLEALNKRAKAYEKELKQKKKRTKKGEDSGGSKAGKKRKKDARDNDQSSLEIRPKKNKREEVKQADECQPGGKMQTPPNENTGNEPAIITGLNPAMRCERPLEQHFTSIQDVLRHQVYRMMVAGKEREILLPFINTKSLVAVRVVDFWPHDIRRFTKPSGNKRSLDGYDPHDETDGTNSSSSSDSATDGSEDSSSSGIDDPSSSNQWEWNFYLNLQDATGKCGLNNHAGKAPQQNSMWVLVDHLGGGLLLDMPACNLRRHRKALKQVEEKLSILWGNLATVLGRMPSTTTRYSVHKPPPDSEDDALPVCLPITKLSGPSTAKPFACCLHQYGVKVPTDQSDTMTADRGSKWQRLFVVRGAKISMTSS